MSTRVNANVARAEDGTLYCAHCEQTLEGDAATYVSKLPRYEAEVSAVGPHVCAEPRQFVDVDVVFRQYICPGCATAFLTEVVPAS